MLVVGAVVATGMVGGSADASQDSVAAVGGGATGRGSTHSILVVSGGASNWVMGGEVVVNAASVGVKRKKKALTARTATASLIIAPLSYALWC